MDGSTEYRCSSGLWGPGKDSVKRTAQKHHFNRGIKLQLASAYDLSSGTGTGFEPGDGRADLRREVKRVMAVNLLHEL